MALQPGLRVFPNQYQPAYRADQSYVNGNPWNDLLPPAFVIENYLAGLPLQATANGANLQGIVQQKINAAIGLFEQKMGSFLVPRQIMAAVMGTPPAKVIDISPEGFANMGPPAEPGVDFDLLEVPYDYTSRRFEQWSLVKVRHTPIIGVASILFALPPNFGILVVPQPWIVPSPNTGIIQIVPVEGAMAVTSPGAGMWLPFFTMGQMNHVPQFTQISYTSGIYPIPDDMVDAVACMAASLVLEVYNVAYYPGIQSFENSGAGFNQSVTMRADGPFSSQIKNFRGRAEEYMKSWRNSHSGLRIASLGR